MTTARAFKQIDGFTPVPYRGNPLAVVRDGQGLSSALKHVPACLPPGGLNPTVNGYAKLGGRTRTASGHRTIS